MSNPISDPGLTAGDIGGLLEAARFRVANDRTVDQKAGMAQRYDEIEQKLSSALLLLELEDEPVSMRKFLSAPDNTGVEKAVEGHRVEIEFDGFPPSVRLIHPEAGCPAGEEGEGCWLTDWLENEGIELVRGKLTLPVRWEQTPDRDHPLFHLAAIQPFLTQPDEDDLEHLVAAVRRLFDPEVVDLLAQEFCSRQDFARRLSSFSPEKQEQFRNSALQTLFTIARHVLDNRLPEGTFSDIGIPISTEELAAQPQLSDEDRERLRRIAFDLDGEEGSLEETSAEAAAFLRKLASQQVEGNSDREQLTMIALALKNEGIEDCTPEVGVEQLITLLAAYRSEGRRQHGEEDAPPVQRLADLLVFHVGRKHDETGSEVVDHLIAEGLVDGDEEAQLRGLLEDGEGDGSERMARLFPQHQVPTKGQEGGSDGE